MTIVYIMYLYTLIHVQTDWSEFPTSQQNSLNPKRRVAGALFLLRPPGAERPWQSEEETLPGGKYLLKVYLDSKQRLKSQPTVMLGESDFYGQTIVVGPWTKTFRQARKIAGNQLIR